MRPERSSRPLRAADVSIFTSVWTWNNFLCPFLAATSQTMMIIPAGIGTVISGVGIINALQMASAVLGALPLVVVFLLARRQIVEGVAGTGLKQLAGRLSAASLTKDRSKYVTGQVIRSSRVSKTWAAKKTHKLSRELSPLNSLCPRARNIPPFPAAENPVTVRARSPAGTIA